MEMAKRTAEDRKLEREFSEASSRISTRQGWVAYQNARMSGMEHYDALDLAFKADFEAFN